MFLIIVDDFLLCKNDEQEILSILIPTLPSFMVEIRILVSRKFESTIKGMV